MPHPTHQHDPGELHDALHPPLRERLRVLALAAGLVAVLVVLDLLT